MSEAESTDSRWVKELKQCETKELEFMLETIQAIIDERNES